MKVGERILQRLDSLYHEDRLPVIGAVFCDLWDMNAGVPAKTVIKDRIRKLHKAFR